MHREKYIQRHKQTAISIVNTQVEAIRNKDIIRTGYRIYEEGLIGISGGIGDVDDKQLEEEAVRNLELKIPYPYEMTTDVERVEDCKEDDANKVTLLKDVEEMMEVLRKNYPEFIVSEKITIEELESTLTNDQNLYLQSKDKFFILSLIVKEESSANIFDTGVGGVFRNWDKKAMLKEITNHLDAYKNKLELPDGEKVPVIFQGSETYLVLSKVLEELNGYKIGTKASLFTEVMGQQKFSRNFTLYQDRSKESLMRLLREEPFFDSEGVVNDDLIYTLIKEGKIVTGYTDKKTAHLFNMPVTGAAASSYDGVPSLAVPPVSIASSEKTLKEILGGKIGVLVIVASGGDYTAEGHFATPVQVAMLTDGEKLLGRVPEFEMSGHMYEMFGEDFIGCSEDRPFNGMNGLVVNMKIKR